MFPSMGLRMHWPFDDPASFIGSEVGKLEKFREIRDQIEKRILAWLDELAFSIRSKIKCPLYQKLFLDNTNIVPLRAAL